MHVREERGRYVIEPVPTEPKTIDLSGIYGAGAGLKPLRDEDREFEPRQLDWDGRLAGNG